MIKKKKTVKQDGIVLSEKKAFYDAFFHWNGKNYLTGERMSLTSLKAHNFAHVLSKEQFRYFKYCYKNIVILTLCQHKLFDELTQEKLQTRMGEHPEEKWCELFDYVLELKEEYYQWIKTNPKEYKLS